MFYKIKEMNTISPTVSGNSKSSQASMREGYFLSKKITQYAPIILFVYNRRSHTQQTIEALKRNVLAEKSHLFIFSDAPKHFNDISHVEDVRNYIREINGFLSVAIVEREHNLGLANSIIDGVTRLCDEFGRVIVLEDDIVTSVNFLQFMNRGLDLYTNEKKVWHISGWNYPIDLKELPEAFFWRTMNCWGWATWADRWKYFHKDPEKLIDEWDTDHINKFNLDGAHDFWSQVTANASGKLNTWAIFWYATIFQSQGLCLNPANTYVKNIGHDGSGENCGATNIFNSDLSHSVIKNFPHVVDEHGLAVKKIKQFYESSKPSLLSRILKKLKISTG